MGIVLVFLLGIGNFAAQRAVFESDHPMLASLSPRTRSTGKALSMGVEFCLLVAAMLAATRGLAGWLWLYVGYSVLNLLAAWVIAKPRF